MACVGYFYGVNTLYVIRHAKSSWNGNEADFDRPLNERGEKDAPSMAARLKEKQVMPDIIISSTAKRAKKTALAFAKVLGYDEKNILWKDEIYESSVQTIFGIVRNIDTSYKHVLLFGHNPTFTYFVNELAAVRIDNIPTCGIAAIAIEGDWTDVNEDKGKLLWFDYPKNI